VGYFEIQSQHSPGKAEENHENLRTGDLVTRPRCQLGTYKYKWTRLPIHQAAQQKAQKLNIKCTKMLV
jgi:hypothetical protein